MQNCEERLDSSCLFTCPSVRMEQLSSQWTDFYKIRVFFEYLLRNFTVSPCISYYYVLLYQLMHLLQVTLKSLKTPLLKKTILHVSIFQDHHQGFTSLLSCFYSVFKMFKMFMKKTAVLIKTSMLLCGSICLCFCDVFCVAA